MRSSGFDNRADLRPAFSFLNFFYSNIKMSTFSPASSLALTISELATTAGGVTASLPDDTTAMEATTMSVLSSTTVQPNDNSGWSSGFDDQVRNFSNICRFHLKKNFF